MADVPRRTSALNYYAALVGVVVSFAAIAFMVGRVGCSTCPWESAPFIAAGIALGGGVFLGALGIFRIRNGSTTTVRTAVGWIVGPPIGVLVLLTPSVSVVA